MSAVYRPGLIHVFSTPRVQSVKLLIMHYLRSRAASPFPCSRRPSQLISRLSSTSYESHKMALPISLSSPRPILRLGISCTVTYHRSYP